ncbi:MAG TPA: iron-sulfur cluster assembly scaffold protein [Pyrinomonadaceae bacterium]|nr:iron-sulfur cluster assembly scaffold protein [Pyrinomonadaceae bacterium]
MSVYTNNLRRAIADASKGETVAEFDAVGTSASFECGCFVRFYLGVNITTQVIERTFFQTNGCGYMVASAKVLGQQLKGKNLRDLHGLDSSETAADVHKNLGDFPLERLQCREVAIEAVTNAFAEYRLKQVEEFRGEKALICTCFGVSEETIETFIAEKHLREVSEVSAICNAGSGCGSCHFLIQEMIDAHTEA